MKAEKILEALGEIDEKFIEEAMNYNMKKKFNWKPIIAVAACAAFALAAIPVANHFANNDMVDGGTTAGTVAPVPGDEVDDDVDYVAYEYSVNKGEIIGNHVVELKVSKSRGRYVIKDKLDTQKTVYLNGMEWTAKYENSWSETDYKVIVDRYTGVCNGRNMSFGVNSITGKCEFFMFKTTGDIDKTVKLTRDELYEIAYDNFLSGGYTEDPENYQLSDECSNGSAGYWFKFTRFVDGIETSEHVRIGLRNNGDLYWFVGNRIGEMKDVDVSGFDMDKIYDAIEIKVKKIYGDAYVDFEREGAVLRKRTDGSYVFDYSGHIDVKNSYGKVVQERCFLIVIMD
ncbi:MAG: hypothetical protein IJX27_01175 [Clostridia bacterium]|nr:hypothetical protein [Clostridia bacterium]